MKKENLIKAALIFGGGYLVFALAKSMKKANASGGKSSSSKKSFDDSTPKAPVPTAENAKIVLTAYTDALNAGESPSRLTELNKECMKEFGMRCYVDDTNKVVVCDVKGEPINL